MFKAGQTNQYDEIVNKTTDENLTSENWELILNLCDKVQDEGQSGAHDVIAAVLKRLAHRNPNVQLYTLSLVEALSKNCSIELHREIASRAFTSGLEKIIVDRNTHEKVKRRALVLVAMWTGEFENDSTLGIMEDLYNNLKAKNYKFEAPEEPPPPAVDDEVRRREEEELQRVLEMSVQDKGGRDHWAAYTTVSSNGAGGSSSASAAPASSSAPAYTPEPKTSSTAATYQSGYVPARTPSPKARAASPTSLTTSAETGGTPAPSTTAESALAQGNIVTRVRALHTFEPTEPGELAFEKGDIIKVVDRGYKDWWRGQLKGRTGIFPVNYVEAMPEPTASELAKEAEQEAAVFSQAANVDKLLTMLRTLDPTKDNLADNEEIQELYRSSMALRPKIVKLIDKYSQKRADLVSMNETFVRARTIFDRMMEESLSRYGGGTGVYDAHPGYAPQPPYNAAQSGSPQVFGWDPNVYSQPGYNAFPAAPAAYPQGPEGAYPHPQGQHQPQGHHQPYADPNAYPQQQPGYPQQQPGYPAQGATPAGAYASPTPYPQGQQQQPAVTQPAEQHPQAQPQGQPIPQQQPQQQQQPVAAQPQSQPQPGPPYVYDPNGTYEDQNVQAWANYYAQGGKDLAGAVYFISIPGVTDGTSEAPNAGVVPQQSAQPAVHQQPPIQPDNVANAPSSSPIQDTNAGYRGPQTGSSDLPGYDTHQATPLAPPQDSSAPLGNVPGSYAGIGSIAQQAASASSTWKQHPQESPTTSAPNSTTHHDTYQAASEPSSAGLPISMMPGRGQHSPQFAHNHSSSTGSYRHSLHGPPTAVHDTHHSQTPPPQSAEPLGAQQQQYYGLPQQFAGVDLRDGTRSPPGGGHQQRQAHHSPPGVGAPA